MRSIIVAAGLAMSLCSAPALATQQEDFAKAVGKLVSDPTKPPRKGLCACLTDAFLFGVKRTGFLLQGTVGGSIAVSCLVPVFDDAGAQTDVVPCPDWELLTK
jgi:hypothetical protein